MKKISLLLIPSIIIGFQNCSEVEALKEGKSFISYKNAVAGSPILLPILSKQRETQEQAQVLVPHQSDANPINEALVAQQIEIIHERDIAAGYSVVVDNVVVPVPVSTPNPIPDPQQTALGPDCRCDQFNKVSGGFVLEAHEQATFSPEALMNILNVEHTQLICDVGTVGSGLTGELTFFRCTGRGYGNRVFDYNVEHYGYRAPNGCQASGRPATDLPILSCRHPADTSPPYGILTDEEFVSYTGYQGLAENGLPDNDPMPSPSCRNMYDLYIGIAIGTGQNSTYFPNRSLECRAAYFAAAYAGTNLETGANNCFDEMVAINTTLTPENCPQPEHFNCQTSATGCTN